MIGRHKIQLLSFYPNLLRYLNSHNKDKISEIFAMIIESCHDLVPPETIKPVIERIISNYVTEYCNNAHITIGINAIREILMRMPLALDPDQIEYLCLFRSFRNKSVSAAAKSLVNYFRDVCPELLPKKMRGRFAVIDEDNEKANIVFGAQKLHRDIEGIDLLKKPRRSMRTSISQLIEFLMTMHSRRSRYYSSRKASVGSTGTALEMRM